jgi:hypothetical protein
VAASPRRRPGCWCGNGALNKSDGAVVCRRFATSKPGSCRPPVRPRNLEAITSVNTMRCFFSLRRQCARLQLKLVEDRQSAQAVSFHASTRGKPGRNIQRIGCLPCSDRQERTLRALIITRGEWLELSVSKRGNIPERYGCAPSCHRIKSSQDSSAQRLSEGRPRVCAESLCWLTDAPSPELLLCRDGFHIHSA